MADSSPLVRQEVSGAGNIFSGTGDVIVIQQAAPLVPEQVAARRDLRNLLEKVKTFWIEGVLEKSLYTSALINLRKRVEVDAVQHPWEMVLAIPGQDDQILPPDTRIVDVFKQRNNTLLILGEPGSGKTTSLLELARDLIIQAETSPDFAEPNPIVLSLSTWAEKHPSLEDWIVEELSSKYQVSRQLGRSWLTHRRLLPLLDGLDEVQPESQAACVNTINTFGESFGLIGLVVCSRLREYTSLPVRLKLSGAISLQPLTREHVDNYLASAGARLEGLRAALQTEADLQSLATSPLMLNIMSLAYQDLPTEVLADQSSVSLEERRKRLFDTYIERMFERKGKAPLICTRQQAKVWLNWLAQEMRQNNQTIFMLEELQPRSLSSRWQRFFYTVSSRTLAVLVLWLPLFWAFANDASILRVSLFSGFIIGLLDWLFFETGVREADKTPVSVLIRSVIKVLLIFLIMDVAVALDRLLFYGDLPQWRDFLWGELVFSILPVAVFFGVLASNHSITNDIRPVEAMRLSWFGLIRGGIYGLLVGLLSWISTLVYDWAAGRLVDFKDFYRLVFSGGVIGIVLVGFSKGHVETKTRPNSGIRISARNATIFLLIIWIIPWLGYRYKIAGFAYMTGYIGYVATLPAMWFGGFSVIQHTILRYFLAINRSTPWNYVEFLEFASRRTFLQKVGGGYTFSHRLLQEHFAELRA